MIAPVFQQYANEYSRPNVLTFVKVDTDTHANLAQKYKVSSYVLINVARLMANPKLASLQ